MNEIGYLLAFTTGVFGTLHCLGMCSGLAASCAAGDPPGLGPVLRYHVARILAYGVVGMAGALAGQVLVQSGGMGKAQGLLMMSAGVLVCLFGLRLVLANPPLRAFVRGLLPPFLGVLNGLVPCSLVFSVALPAAATQDPWRAAALMISFGLGTLPTMALVSFLALRGLNLSRGAWARLAGSGVLLLGLWTLWQGWVFFDVMRGLVD